MGDHPRYDTPWVRAEHPCDALTVRHGEHSLELRRSDASRVVSGFCARAPR